MVAEAHSSSLSVKQLKAFQKGEPRTLGAIQIIIAMLTLCLTVILTKQDLKSNRDAKVLYAVVVQVAISGCSLVHAGRKPSYSKVKFSVVFHLVSGLISIAGFGLLSKHLPYSNYYSGCEMYVNGLASTVIIFLVLELLICITSMLYGLNTMITEGPEEPSSSSADPQACSSSVSQQGLTGVDAQL